MGSSEIPCILLVGYQPWALSTNPVTATRRKCHCFLRSPYYYEFKMYVCHAKRFYSRFANPYTYLYKCIRIPRSDRFADKRVFGTRIKIYRLEIRAWRLLLPSSSTKSGGKHYTKRNPTTLVRTRTEHFRARDIFIFPR